MSLPSCPTDSTPEGTTTTTTATLPTVQPSACQTGMIILILFIRERENKHSRVVETLSCVHFFRVFCLQKVSLLL